MQVFASRATTALTFFLVLVHGVLKCAHHPVLKYVTLRHPAASSHDFLHSSRLDAIADDLRRFTSPAPWSHLTLWLSWPHAHSPLSSAVAKFTVEVKLRHACVRRLAASLVRTDATCCVFNSHACEHESFFSAKGNGCIYSANQWRVLCVIKVAENITRWVHGMCQYPNRPFISASMSSQLRRSAMVVPEVCCDVTTTMAFVFSLMLVHGVLK